MKMYEGDIYGTERARREADEIRSLPSPFLSAFSRCITRIMHTCSNCRWQHGGKRREGVEKGTRRGTKIAKRGRKRGSSFCFQTLRKLPTLLVSAPDRLCSLTADKFSPPEKKTIFIYNLPENVPRTLGV